MKICVPVNSGGHLTQALTLTKSLKGHEIFFVTFHHERLNKYNTLYKFYFITDPGRNLFKLLKLLIKAIKIFLIERPDVLLSTGANVSIPFFILGKLLNKKLIYIESISRVTRPSLSGRLIYKIADLFFIQWESLRKYYPKAVYAGRLM